MKRLYEPEAYDTSYWPESFWRASVEEVPEHPALEGDREAEVAIIGAGYTGLGAALELAERYGTEPVLLDAAQPGWGASGRNGGFACIGGSKLPDATVIERHGLDAAQEFHRFQRAAIDTVADNLDRYGIEADTHSEGELCLAHRPGGLAELRAEAETARRRYGLATEVLSRPELAERGMGAGTFHGGLITRAGFALNPMKYVLGLARAAGAAGVAIHGQSPVTAIRRDGARWRLETPGGTLRTGRVIVATNGYSSEDIPPALAGVVLPALSSILVTRPLEPAELQTAGWRSDMMAYDTRRLLHYFRLMPCGRFLFGTRGGLSAGPGAARQVRAMARRQFEAIFPGWAHVETPWFWSGLVALTGSLTPVLTAAPGTEGVILALGYHGNGVATGSHAGRVAAALAMGEDRRPALLRAAPRRFPLPRLRRTALRAAYAAYALRDGPVGA
ncbi:FAD-dependent oxidoreductase [Maritimibacter sp. 55A14]|uniref:NAD(P)/FAD-dependent oxidoreductase n=1 Tax=Maritimibacter sp. 55A14 TaxID=2174844 RepID=UPI000D61F285|nr:FAD-binding oxidoreductase [Maritimibacter sp. 55A14]PWE34249.1 FAD-dependent oxidoreductase [Maritimibacter sp. 55A14]